ncbi:MAG: GNAT family N-acetyltransferase [Planctomycetota bacterium]
MSHPPTLMTSRLRLRPFRSEDAPEVQRLAGDRRVADGTLHVPHPYPDGEAERWIATLEPAFDAKVLAQFAIVDLESDELRGSIGLQLNFDHDTAELGYWIGPDYWGQGLATEAGRAVVAWGFEELGCNRISAHHFSENIASGRVLLKIGMQHEGHVRQAIKKDGQYLDIELYAILRSDRR